MSCEFSPLIQMLIHRFRVLPGVGPRSAQRMALYLLRSDRLGGMQLASALSEAMDKVVRCSNCRMFCEGTKCGICSTSRADSQSLCIVESPSDCLAIEEVGEFKGTYFVLHGALSPMDGLGPEDLGIDLLKERVKSEGVKEVILATNSTVEGEVTANFLMAALSSCDVEVSRIAYGVPVGGELSSFDCSTLARAFEGRKNVLCE